MARVVSRRWHRRNIELGLDFDLLCRNRRFCLGEDGDGTRDRNSASDRSGFVDTRRLPRRFLPLKRTRTRNRQSQTGFPQAGVLSLS
jgi:hypothetical protein